MAKKQKPKAPSKAGALATEYQGAPRASAATVAAADQAQAPGTAGAAVAAPAAVEGGASPPSAPRTGQEDAAIVGAGAASSEQNSSQPGPSEPAAGGESSAPAEPPADAGRMEVEIEHRGGYAVTVERTEGGLAVEVDPETPRAGELMLIVRTRHRQTRRRAGRAFGPEETAIPLGVLTLGELRAIESDPELIAEVETL